MCFKCKNKRSEFNQKVYDDNHKKIDYAAFLAAGGVDDESTKQEQQEEVVDVREMDDDDGPPTLCVARRPVTWVVSSSSLSRFGPRRGRRGVSERLR